MQEVAKMCSSAEKELILSVSSLFDGEFSIDWVEEITKMKASQILSTLEECVKDGLLSRKGPGIYVFLDKKKRESFTQKLDDDQKSRFHRHIVTILMREMPDDATKILKVAEHLLRVSPLDTEECQILLRAGEIYGNSLISEKAIPCFEKVLKELSGKVGKDDFMFIKSAINFSNIFAARHNIEVSYSYLREAKKRAKRIGDSVYEAVIDLHMAKYERLMGKFNSALKRFAKAISKLRSFDTQELKDESIRFQIYFLFWQGRFKDVVEVYERSVPDVEKYPVGHFPVVASVVVGHSYAMVGNITHGTGMLDAIHEYCLKKKDYYLAAHASSAIAMIMLSVNYVEEALKYLEIASREAKEGANFWANMIITVMRSYVCYVSGEKEKAVKFLRKFLKHIERMRLNILFYPFLAELMVAIGKGDLPPLFDFSFEKEMAQLKRVKNPFLKGVAYRYLALWEKSRGSDERKIHCLLLLSSKHLEKSGHSIEITKTRLELAKYYVAREEHKKATNVLRSVRKIPFIDNIFPDEIRSLLQEVDSAKHVVEEVMDITVEIARNTCSGRLFQKLMASLNRVIGAERGGLFVLEEKTKPPKLALRTSKNMSIEEINSLEFESTRKVLAEIMETEQGRIVEIERNGRRISGICVPVIFQGYPLGVLYHENRLFPKAFNENHLKLMTYFSALIGIWLERERTSNALEFGDLDPTSKQTSASNRGSIYISDGFIGKSPAIKSVMSQVEEVSRTDIPVLLLGETGVGKSLIAKIIHDRSYRKDGPFVTVQCTALTESIITSELFGHEKGAFTGAIARHIGKIERANGGTLFLDEVGDLPLDVQARLLRVLETKEFERVGGRETLRSNFRLIMATNKNLEAEVKEKKFREDLFYRINVFPIYIPPLRERKEDIPLLFQHFLHMYSLRYGKAFQNVPRDIIETLQRYSWPGNIRELENIIQRSIIVSPDSCFQLLPLESFYYKTSEPRIFLTLKENEKFHILQALTKSNWKIYGHGGAAELLDLKPTTLISRMKKLGIRRPNAVTS